METVTTTNSRRAPHGLGGLRALALLAVIVAGLVTLVGSGGGGLVSVSGCLAPGPCPGDFPPEPRLPTVEPHNATVQVGGSATFTVSAPDFAKPTFQWSRASQNGAFVDIAGATAASYTLAGAQLPDDGAAFRVKVRGEFNGTPAVADSSPGRLAVSSMPGVVFQDSEFLATDWATDAVTEPATNGPTHAEEQVLAGGNPGAWRKTSIVMSNGPSKLELYQLYQAAAYDPATQGAIYLIEFAQDCLQLPGTPASAPLFLIEQDGRRYIASTFAVCGSPGWSTAAYPGRFDPGGFLQVSGPACTSGTACPDFGSGGKPIRFGLFDSLEARTGIPGVTVGFGTDNWKVTVWRR